ncbi:MAG: DUF1836 domain-containing protein [Lachnospiraceae bacterium]|nr:DUF1836 domain-containing protein [Lachnospiraceae bacterium]
MTIDKNDLLNSIIQSLDRIQYIKVEDIPNIDLYMDQVTTFMESKLKSSVRNPEEDKILTKTMINNYAKNDLLPPPIKKKYSKEHVIMLIFIYYYKGILSINDIQALLNPISDKYFQTNGEINLSTIYEEIFSHEKAQVDLLKEDIISKYETASKMMQGAPDEDKEMLQLFSFIGLLGFDVYIKKLLIEKIVDGYCNPPACNEKEKNPEKKKEK